MGNIREQRQRSRESLVTLVFTLFSAYLAYVAGTQGWSLFILPVIVGEVFFVWWSYIRSFQSFSHRAVYLTILASINIIFYGIHAIDFYVLIPTLSLFMVLITIYQLRLAVDIVIGAYIVLLIYHFPIKRHFFSLTDAYARDRAVLQLLSLFILTLLSIYAVHRRAIEERDMDMMEEMVRHAEKIKDDFIVNTSHELRTPIHTIAGMSEILLQENLPDNVHREALDIQMTGIELQTIVTDIMDFAALEAGRMELSPRSYNITSTLNDIMNMSVFQNREKNLELIFDCDPAIPQLLYGDEQQLRRVINNLIGNAVKFTTKGGVRVSVTCRKEGYGVNLVVSVKDTGIGMSPQEQESVFNVFYQADANRNRRVEGMGLGLTISSAIIKKMGGFMSVKSTPGKGSEFAFSVPQEVRDESPCITLAHPGLIRAIWYFDEQKYDTTIRDDYLAHIENTAAYLGITMLRSSSLTELKRRMRSSKFTHLLIGTEEYRGDPLFFDETALQLTVMLLADRDAEVPSDSHVRIVYKPYNAMTLAEFFNHEGTGYVPARTGREARFIAPDAKVLVVDDNLMNLKVVEGLLRRYRIRISAASSGLEALSLINSRDYDFVFMDHMMPGMDGIECFHRIRAKQSPDGYFQRVPVIALTANAIAGSREMFLSEGFNDFVAKPIDNALLDHVLRTYIPAEKQIEESQEAVMLNTAEESDAAEEDPFAAMEGIDLKTALAYCGGSREDYADLARIYLQTGTRYEHDLQTFYDKNDWKQYAVIAHAVKSTSRTLGAQKLSDLAFRCETAAKENNAAVVEQYHKAMLSEYARVRGVFAANPQIAVSAEGGETVAHEPLTQDEWRRLKEKMINSLETFETGAYESLLEEYASRSLHDEPLSLRLKDVTEKVQEFDFDGAIRLLDPIGSRGEGV